MILGTLKIRLDWGYLRVDPTPPQSLCALGLDWGYLGVDPTPPQSLCALGLDCGNLKVDLAPSTDQAETLLSRLSPMHAGISPLTEGKTF